MWIRALLGLVLDEGEERMKETRRSLLLLAPSPRSHLGFWVLVVEMELFQPARAGDAAALRRQLAQGANANIATLDRRSTLLHCAASNARHECVAVLIDARANVNAVDSSGNTPLHMAALSTAVNQEHGLRCIELLMDGGADMNVRNVRWSLVQVVDERR